ncbi:MAG: D-alanyl-D-alanine carboxypeptidase family protein [Actinomycetota bacterium]
MTILARATIFITLLAAMPWMPAPALAQEAAPPPAVGMASGILVDATEGKVLWSKEPDVPRPPASLTKVVTALVVLERTKLDDPVTYTAEAQAAPGGKIRAEVGWTFSVEDLLWGLLLHSGNDAAIALATSASPDGTEAGFVRLMNERARALGASASTFQNSHGYDQPGHLSTARDLALLTMVAMKNRTFARMVASSSHEVTWGNAGRRTFWNHNRLLTGYPGAIGVKTGYTGDAGRCLISAARRGETTLIGVTLNSPGRHDFAESAAMFDWGFANLDALSGQLLGILAPIKPRRETRAPDAPGFWPRVISLGKPPRPAGEAGPGVLPGPSPTIPGLIALGVGLSAGVMTWTRSRRRRSRNALA